MTTTDEARVARGAVAPLTAFFGTDVFQGSSSAGAEAGVGEGSYVLLLYYIITL